MKSELERRELQINRILENGNEMLKNSEGDSSNLARRLKSLNTKWSNLSKKCDDRNKIFTMLSQYVNELKREFKIHFKPSA